MHFGISISVMESILVMLKDYYLNLNINGFPFEGLSMEVDFYEHPFCGCFDILQIKVLPHEYRNLVQFLKITNKWFLGPNYVCEFGNSDKCFAKIVNNGMEFTTARMIDEFVASWQKCKYFLKAWNWCFFE